MRFGFKQHNLNGNQRRKKCKFKKNQTNGSSGIKRDVRYEQNFWKTSFFLYWISVSLFMFLSFFQNDSLLASVNKAQKTSDEDVPGLSLKEMKGNWSISIFNPKFRIPVKEVQVWLGIHPRNNHSWPECSVVHKCISKPTSVARKAEEKEKKNCEEH